MLIAAIAPTTLILKLIPRSSASSSRWVTWVSAGSSEPGRRRLRSMTRGESFEVRGSGEVGRLEGGRDAVEHGVDALQRRVDSDREQLLVLVPVGLDDQARPIVRVI